MADCRKNRIVGLAALAVVATGVACGNGTKVEENRAPVAEGEIPPLTVVAGESWMGSISQFFSDPDGDPLTYEAESSNTDAVTVSMSGAQLTAKAEAVGMSTVTITAMDPDSLTAEQSTVVTVTPPNRPPVIQAEIPDLTIKVGEDLEIDLSLTFSDPDGDALTIEAESESPDVATVEVDGFNLTVTAVAAGETTITVTATDPGGLSVTDTFVLTVEEDS